MKMRNSDAALVNAVLAGNVDAYDSLVKRYQKSVYATARSVVGDSATAEDIAQEAFMTALTRLSRLRDPAAFAAWLRRITANAARMWLRNQPSPKATSHMDSFVDSKTRETCCLHDEVTSALNSLSATKREVATLCYMDGLSRKDAANFLGVNESTLRKRLHDAKRLLQRRIVEAAERNMEEHLLPRGFESRCICACQRALEARMKEVNPMRSDRKDCGCGCWPPPSKEDRSEKTEQKPERKNPRSKKQNR
jgi:RNA polymerase sigma-70 factor (ECF subfamily)